MTVSFTKNVCRFKFWHRLFSSLLWALGMIFFGIVVIIFLKAYFLYPITEIGIFTSHSAIDFIDEAKILERAERLAGALRIPTISYEAEKQDKAAILKFHQYLEKSFPLVHSSPFIKREVINGYSLLYTVEGSVPGKLQYLLASHLDVVPVEPRSWDVPPFSGNIVNKTYIYGRGAMDDKTGVMSIMEALEYLLATNQRPMRSFYLAFGHDEEISGKNGAQEIAKTLKSRGVTKLDFVVDEGFPIVGEVYPGIEGPVATVGVTEKGFLTLELSVAGTPGHSSFPPAETAIGVLASAVSKLEKIHHTNLFGSGPEFNTYQYLAPYASFWYRLIYSNLWLFSGLMSRAMEEMKETRPFVRTTTAITKFNGGIKENVVPPIAVAIINHRVHPAQTISQVIKYDREIIDDPRVTIRVKNSREAHPISTFGPSSVPYSNLAHTIKQVWKNAVVAPGVFIANTDTRWYLNFTKALYRFLPIIVTKKDLGGYHGNNERITIKSYHGAVNFYYRLIKNSDYLIDQTPSTVPSAEEKEL